MVAGDQCLKKEWGIAQSGQTKKDSFHQTNQPTKESAYESLLKWKFLECNVLQSFLYCIHSGSGES